MATYASGNQWWSTPLHGQWSTHLIAEFLFTSGLLMLQHLSEKTNQEELKCLPELPMVEDRSNEGEKKMWDSCHLLNIYKILDFKANKLCGLCIFP